jgi:hypothetical protein
MLCPYNTAGVTFTKLPYAVAWIVYCTANVVSSFLQPTCCLSTARASAKQLMRSFRNEDIHAGWTCTLLWRGRARRVFYESGQDRLPWVKRGQKLLKASPFRGLGKSNSNLQIVQTAFTRCLYNHQHQDVCAKSNRNATHIAMTPSIKQSVAR